MHRIGDGRLHNNGRTTPRAPRFRCAAPGRRGFLLVRAATTAVACSGGVRDSAAEPLEAFRRLAAAAARALRVAKWQTHLEREIGAQEIRQVGAVGANDEPHLIFAQTQMVEQDIARLIAQHFMQRRPRQRRVERRVEELLDPCGDTDFPSRDSRYCAMARRFPPSRSAAAAGRAHGDVARDRAAPGGARSRASVACHVPAAGDATSANQKYGGPPCRSRDLTATFHRARSAKARHRWASPP